MSGTSVLVAETVHAGQDAVQITTPSAVWTYQLEAGGFSSLKDRDGSEWIGFAPGTPGPSGPANVFRGIPNLVYPDNIGHPGYTHVRTECVVAGDRVELVSTAKDGAWQWRWTVSGVQAELTVLRAPKDRRYWFLYEGTPGGRYDPRGATWGCDAKPSGGANPALSHPLTGAWRWIWFGHPDSPRVLSLHHATATGEPSMLGWMDAAGGDGMVVFGFGRSHGDGPISHLGGSHGFAVRFVEFTDPDRISNALTTGEEE